MELHVIHATLGDLQEFLKEKGEEEELGLENVLGRRYTDSVTGFSGIATSICLNLHSETLVHLENDTNSRWIEEGRLEVFLG